MQYNKLTFGARFFRYMLHLPLHYSVKIDPPDDQNQDIFSWPYCASRCATSDTIVSLVIDANKNCLFHIFINYDTELSKCQSKEYSQLPNGCFALEVPLNVNVNVLRHFYSSIIYSCITKQ